MLQGRQVVLRAAKGDYIEALSRLRNDLEIQLALMASPPRPNSESQVREWISRRSTDPQGAFFVVAQPESDEALGFIQLSGIDLLNGYADLGICISAEARGKGRAVEALALLEGYALSVLKLRKIVLRVLVSNGTAVALYERTGYRRVGVLEQHHYAGGKFDDVLIMEKHLGRIGL